MIALSENRTISVSAPPLAPADRPIDFEHLSRMTLGEAELEREVLTLFDRQAGMLMQRMREGTAATIAAAAHTLKGSAVGIGAFPLARAATRVENAASTRGPDLNEALAALAARVDEARALIADLLRAKQSGTR